MADIAVATQEEDIEATAPEESASSLRGALRLLIASGVGKAGIGLFLIMLAISLYVLVAYPLDFGSARWSNPAYWADYPQSVPPAWSAWLTGRNPVPQTTLRQAKPNETKTFPAGEIRTYDLSLSYTANEAPKFLSFTLPGVTYYGQRPPVVTATLLRPDGTQVRLANIVVSGPRPGESAPYRRYYDTPDRIDLTQQQTAATSLGQVYAQKYAGLNAPSDLSGSLAAGLFGRPAANGSGNIVPLKGKYTIQAQTVVANPKDTFVGVKAVMGGTVYGWMGTDTLGRDLIQGLLYGFPVALLIATLTAVFSTLIGASLGIVSGYAGGVTDGVIQRLSDIISNVPTLPLLIFLVFVLGSHLSLIILVLVAFSWPGLTILVRSMVLQIRSGQLVEAARALGASRWRIMLRHVFPQTAPFIVAQMIFFAPGAILAEASLSFLGLGDPSIPTWGQMLQAGFSTGALYVGYWWWIVPPGLLIVITALAFMLFALAMEPVVDPRLRPVT